MVEKHSYQEWKAFIDDIQQSREKTDELSKLYIIIHEKVRNTIKNCTLDPKYNAHNEVQEHLAFIKNILVRLANANEDSYLSKINSTTLNRYEKNLFKLVDFLRTTAIIEESKETINLQ